MRFSHYKKTGQVLWSSWATVRNKKCSRSWLEFRSRQPRIISGKDKDEEGEVGVRTRGSGKLITETGESVHVSIRSGIQGFAEPREREEICAMNSNELLWGWCCGPDGRHWSILSSFFSPERRTTERIIVNGSDSLSFFVWKAWKGVSIRVVSREEFNPLEDLTFQLF